VVVGLLRTGSCFCFFTLLNLVGAELVDNVWSFATMATNHCGSDLWCFSTPCKAESPEFFLRAVLGSTAFPAGDEITDYVHGYVNYQPEHHAFPELSPLHYQRLHRRFKAVCFEHGVPYVQESVPARMKKTVDIMVGLAKLKPITDGQAVDQPEKWILPMSY